MKILCAGMEEEWGLRRGADLWWVGPLRLWAVEKGELPEFSLKAR